MNYSNAIHKLLIHIYQNLNLPSSMERRKLLLNNMEEISQENLNCNSCNGKCCSFEANSMQIDLIQSLDLINYLLLTNNTVYIDKLKKTIEQYRLNLDLNVLKNQDFRRTYTCPFYTPSSKGCSIEIASKPYGCLAFNKVKDGTCLSDIKLLEDRENQFKNIENSANLKLKEIFDVSWDKKPLPVALLTVYQKIFENEDE